MLVLKHGRDVILAESKAWIAHELILSELKVSGDYVRLARNRYRSQLATLNTDTDFLPDTGYNWRYGTQNGTFWYAFRNLPNKEKIWDDTEDALIEHLSDQNRAKVPVRIKDVDVSDSYLLYAYLIKEVRLYEAHYLEVEAKRRAELGRAASILMGLVDLVTDGRLNFKNADSFKSLCEVLAAEEVKYLPHNHRRLKEKVGEVLNGSVVSEVVYLPRVGNQTARKEVDEEVLQWIYYMRSLGQNFSNAHIFRKIRTLSAMCEKEMMSEGKFNALMASNETKYLTARGRFGSGKKADQWKGYIPSEKAAFAGDCWQVDGTRMNLVAYKDADGAERYLYVIAIRDVYSGDVLGIHWDTKEDRWGYINCFKMAVAFTGHLPYEIVLDKFPGHNTDEFETLVTRMELLGVKVTFTSTKTGKARVERWFETLQSVFMMSSHYYYGEGVQSKRLNAHRSPEYIKRIKAYARQEGYDFDAAIAESMKVMTAYRATKLNTYSKKYRAIDKSPQELYVESEHPNITKLELWQSAVLFAMETIVTLRNEGQFKVEVWGITYMYAIDAEDFDVILQCKTVRVVYDVEDMSRVWIFKDEAVQSEWAEPLCEVKEQKGVQRYGPNPEWDKLQVAKARIKEIDKKRKDILEEKVGDVGDDTLLLGAYSDKDSAGKAETNYLNDREKSWKDTRNEKGKKENRLKVKAKSVSDLEVVVEDVRKMY
jgi:hypothetical protein